MENEREQGEHPSRSSWEAFVEEERYVDEHSPELAHLETCERCQEKVQEVLRMETTLIELLKAEKKEPVPVRENPPCVLQDNLWDYADWLVHRLPVEGAGEHVIPDEFEAVETHLEVCDRCLSDLMAMQKLLTRLEHG